MSKPPVAHKVRFHMGEILCHLSETYPGLLRAVIEAVQNATDADAKVIFVGIDQIEHRVAVCDNGTGITVSKFEAALGTIGQSIKDRKPGTLGRFGLGLVAPVTKCQTMQVVSRPGHSPVNRWLFNQAIIRPQGEELEIPYDVMDGMPVLPEPFLDAAMESRPSGRGSRIVWKTMVLLDRVTTDRTVSTVDIDELARDIRVKLGGGLKAKGTTVFIKIREDDGRILTTRVDPLVYTGQRLDPYEVIEVDAGRVLFSLYRAKTTAGGSRHGEVSVSEEGAADAIGWTDVRRQATRLAAEDTLLTAALEALASGFFEGKITATNIKMHPEREKFIYEDALVGLFSAVSSWYAAVGKALIDEERELRDDERYARLGEQSLASVLARFKGNARLSRLFHTLEEEVFPRASQPPKPESPKPQDREGRKDKKRREVVARLPKRNRGSGDGPGKSEEPLFLTFGYGIIDQDVLWVYDVDTARLTLNVTHPLWVSMDDTNGRHLVKNDRQIVLFQDWLAMEVLYLLASRPTPEGLETGLKDIQSRTEMAIVVLVLR